MVCVIAKVKEWPIEESVPDDWETSTPEEKWGAVRRLEENWKNFMAGGAGEEPTKRKNHRTRRMNNFPHAEEDWGDDGDSEPEVIMAPQ
jgi:hypothetical protein